MKIILLPARIYYRIVQILIPKNIIIQFLLTNSNFILQYFIIFRFNLFRVTRTFCTYVISCMNNVENVVWQDINCAKLSQLLRRVVTLLFITNVWIGVGQFSLAIPVGDWQKLNNFSNTLKAMGWQRTGNLWMREKGCCHEPILLNRCWSSFNFLQMINQ